MIQEIISFKKEKLVTKNQMVSHLTRFMDIKQCLLIFMKINLKEVTFQNKKFNNLKGFQ